MYIPLTVFTICMTRTKFPGVDHFYRKRVLGDHFSTEIFGPGDQNFQDLNSGDRTPVEKNLAVNRLIHSMFKITTVLHAVS